MGKPNFNTLRLRYVFRVRNNSYTLHYYNLLLCCHYVLHLKDNTESRSYSLHCIQPTRLSRKYFATGHPTSLPPPPRHISLFNVSTAVAITTHYILELHTVYLNTVETSVILQHLAIDYIFTVNKRSTGSDVRRMAIPQMCSTAL